jgi:SAM-dependent methyltransferase
VNPLSNENEGVSGNDTPAGESAPVPHPFADELAELLAVERGARVLLVGIGNGRNVAPFVRAGLRVDAVENDALRARDAALRFAAEPGVRVTRAGYAGPYPFASGFAGALCTSALLHGRPLEVGRALAAIRARLRPGAPLFATFGSTRDPRFGRGTRIDAATYAPDDGAESGVPHAFFDAEGLRAVLDGFALDAAHEGSAAQTAGRWAHEPEDAAALMHWFVKARRI